MATSETPIYQGPERRADGQARETTVLTSTIDRERIMDGVGERLSCFMEETETGTLGIDLPAADDKGLITGPAASFITRGQWEVARASGALIVFYGDSDERCPKIFKPTHESPMEVAKAKIDGPVNHARIIHFPGDITMAQAIPPHPYQDYLDRVEEKEIDLPDGKEGNMSLGFGDKKEGILNADAMAVALHVAGQGWMEQMEVLPLMKLAVHPNMQALHYGSALFEGMGCERDPNTGEVCIFDLEGHYNRMRKGAGDLELPCPTFEIFKEMAIKMVQANERFIPPARKGRLYLRPNLFSIGPWMKVGNSNVAALVFTATPIGNASAYFGSVEEEMVFGVPTNEVRSAPGLKGGDKMAGNYAATIRAIHIMEELGLKGGVAYLDRLTQLEPLPLREDFKRKRDWLAAMAKWGVRAAVNFAQLKRSEFKETSASNLVAFQDLGAGRWRVVTPSLKDKDILAGRTRNLLKTIVQKFGWEFAEESVTWEDIQSQKYKFMAGSGTAAYLTPIHAFQRVEIGSREELSMVDEKELDGLGSDDEERFYREKRVGRKVGDVVHLLGRPLNTDPDVGELFPEPLKKIVEEMERVKRGEAEDEAEYAGLITRVTLPGEKAA